MAVGQADLGEQQVLRDRQHHGRHQDAADEQGEDGVPAGKRYFASAYPETAETAVDSSAPPPA
ncbi:hypothetical protein GCM10020220_111840 [Nonomuraea rubra]|uniref:hypothetical protein n=1 Tax=Nonomuraea rubra TaxID=46180 RepID=UPI0031E934B3